jgi:hypothetical protein
LIIGLYSNLSADKHANLSLGQAGGRAIINSDSDERVRRLYADAAKTVRWGGLSFEQALQTITLNPAMARTDGRLPQRLWLWACPSF